MDITIMLLAVSKPLTFPDALKTARRYRRGDVVEVFLTSDVNIVSNPNPKFVYLHVTGIPDTRTFEQVKRKIMQSVNDPVAPIDAPIEWRRRKFRIIASTLPQAVIDAFNADKEYTATWTQTKTYIRKKLVVNSLDRSLDDETEFITDTYLD